MGMDHWIEYNYIDEDGDEVQYEIIEWRKQYWINTVICNYLGYKEDGDYDITLKEIISLRNFFQLCIDEPKLMNICDEAHPPLNYILVQSVKEINEFIRDFDITNLTGTFRYIVCR